MKTTVVMAGATGWVGRAMIPAILAQADMALAGAVARNAAGQDSGTALGLRRTACRIATLDEALATPSDVVVDYTKPDMSRRTRSLAIAKGRHVVIGTSGLAPVTMPRSTGSKGEWRRRAGRRQFLHHRHADEALRLDGGEICAGRGGHRLRQRQEARCAFRHGARTGRGACRGARRVDGAACRGGVRHPGTRGAASGQARACRCIRFGCPPTSFPARRCSACPTSGSRSATTPVRRRRLMWRARCLLSAASRTSRGWCGASMR